MKIAVYNSSEKSAEICIETGGWSFHTIYAAYENGYYIAIPDWGVCVKAGRADDIFYNTENLAAAHDETVRCYARDIALCIREAMKDV